MVLFPCFLFLILVEFSHYKQVLPLNPPLLELKCIPSSSSSSSSSSTTSQNTSSCSRDLLHNLTLNAPPSTSLLTTLNITFGQDHYSGLLQCRPGLTPAQCSLCAAAARTAISVHCSSSDAAAISAWFDGCYIQISSRNPPQYPSISNHYSCSPGTPNPDQFVPALETLLLQLRAAVTIPTRRGFSQGQIAYGDHNQTLCGLVECVRSISTPECEHCVKVGIEKLLIRCGGGNHGGGTVIDGPCLVRFGSTNETVCNSKLDDSAEVTVGASSFSDGDDEHWCRKEAVLAYWGGGVGCFAAAVVLVGLVRRAVLNRAKVGALEFDETVGKS